MKYHQLVQYLAGKSKQDMGNVSSQKETLDSTACFLRRRTSVCKPPNYHEKIQNFFLMLMLSCSLDYKVCAYIYTDTSYRCMNTDTSCECVYPSTSILLHKTDFPNS